MANGGQVWAADGALLAAAKVPVPTKIAHGAAGALTLTMPTLLPGGAAKGDVLTYKGSQGHTYVVANSSAVTTERLKIYSASWFAIYEADGECGHVYAR